VSLTCGELRAAGRLSATSAQRQDELKHPEFLGGSRTRRRPGGRRCSGDGSPEEVFRGVA
jgi:hypothetical protein